MNHTDPSRSLRIQQFVDRVPQMLAACAHIHHELSESQPSLVDALERAVELCDESGRIEVAHCQAHYAYWGRRDLGGDRTLLRQHLGREFDAAVVEIYATFANAYFGAWSYHPGGEDTAALVERIDGRGVPAAVEVVHATSSELTPLRHEAVVAGWLVEVEGLQMLLLACELDERAAQKLAIAAARSAWGDHTSFRQRDYEADVLALLAEPLCIDIGGRGVCVAPHLQAARGGRVFLSPVIEGWGWGLASMDLPAAVQELLTEEGLRHRGEAMPWHLAIARAETAQDLDELMKQLGAVRRRAVTARLEPRHPIGEHTLEVLLPSTELMETVGLTDEGALDERAAYLELSLRQLGVQCHELDQCGVDPDMPLEDALPRTAMLSPQALESLGDAIYLARVRVRWTSILRCWLDPQSHWRKSPTLVELMVGVERLFRSELWHVPVVDLPESVPPRLQDALSTRSARGTWRRLERAVHAAGFTGLRLRVGDLFEFADLLPELDGVGPKTLEHAAVCLAHMLVDWPSGPTWTERKLAASQAS